MKKNYYYLVTSLRDFSFDSDRLPVSICDFYEQAAIELSQDDLQLMRSISYRIDNQNVIAIIEKKDKFLPNGTLPKDLIEEMTKAPDSHLIPLYLFDFLMGIKENERLFPKLSLENELACHYAGYVESLQNDFLKSFTSFDHNIRNILAAMNAKKYGLALEANVLPLNELTENIFTNPSSDFGLAHEFSWFNNILNIYQGNNLFEREKKIAQYYWEYIEELTTYDYFNINKVLGYTLKLFLLERLLKIRSDEGINVFNNITDSLCKDEIIFTTEQA